MSKVTMGIDLGDRYSVMYIVDEQGECVETGRIRTTPAALQRRFADMARARVVVEAGTHSPWVSRLLTRLGHETIVANPRKLRAIYDNDDKADPVDAEYLARVGRADPTLLKPIRHRGEQAQADLAVVRARDALVRTRTLVINHARGTVKALGGRLPKCSAEAFVRRARAHVPPALEPALAPVFQHLEQLTRQIRAYDRQLEQLCAERYPATAVLRQVGGVGPVTALAYVLVLEDPTRFRRSRSVGAYVGAASRGSGSRSCASPGGPSVPPSAAHSSGALYPGTAWRRLCPAAAWGADCGPRGQDRAETRGGRRGAEAGSAAASSVADRGSVRAAPCGRAGGAGELSAGALARHADERTDPTRRSGDCAPPSGHEPAGS